MYTAARTDTRYPSQYAEQLKSTKKAENQASLPTSEFMLVTPELASQLLEGNSINRPLDRNRVNTYVSEIKNGNWKLNGEAIIFDSTGALANGQHRLHAIVKSGIAVMMLVVNGVEKDAMKTMDTGKSRTAADILTLEHFDRGYGKTSMASIVAAISMLIKYKAGATISSSGGNRMLVTTSEINKFFMKHESLLVNLDKEVRCLAKSTNRIAEASQGVALWFILHEIDANLAKEFLHAVYTGVNLKPETPQYHLRNIMLSQRKSGKRKGFRPTDFIYLGIKAWNSIRSGRGIKLEASLRISLDEDRALIVAK